MQFFDRGTVEIPRHFQSEEAKVSRARLRDFFLATDEKLAQSPVPDFSVGLDYFSIKEGLEALFSKKCAFCESVTLLAPYRFRPAMDALPMERNDTGHLCYAWMQNAWENIYPICQGCQPDLPHYFPVEAMRASIPSTRAFEAYASGDGSWPDYPLNETSLLLDPCVVRDFSEHIRVELSGELSALTRSALETIGHFKLNRPELVSRRSQVLQGYSDRLDRIVGGGAYVDADLIYNFPEIEFGGLWKLYFRQLMAELRKQGEVQAFFQPGKAMNIFTAINKDAQRFEGGSNFVLPEPVYRTRRLKSISIRNFKAIEKIDLEMPVQTSSTENASTPLPALLVLGENAAGKSSILEAIALALCSKDERQGLDIDGFELDPRMLGGRAERNDASTRVKLVFQDDTFRTLSISHGRSRARGESALPMVLAYGAFRQYQSAEKIEGPNYSVMNLFNSAVLLPNPEKWLLGLDRFEFLRVARVLRNILSVEGDYEVIHRDYAVQRCFIVTKVAGGTVESRTPLAHASSGYRSMLAMVCDILRALMNKKRNIYFQSFTSASAVVLIDEVEAHLHPRWKIQIMRALRLALPNVTFIATSHDPLCLRGMQENEVVVMQRVETGGNTAARLPVCVEPITQLPDLTRLTVEQLLTSDFFSLMSTDQPQTELNLARMSDLLAQLKSGETLSGTDRALLAPFADEINSVLPVGFTEAQRLVQEAVVEFLSKRRHASAHQMKELRDESRQRILQILNEL